MRHLRAPAVFALALGIIASACGGGSGGTTGTSPGASGAAVSSEPFVMLSTQLNNVTESEAFRSQILSGFTAAKVEYRGEDAGPFADRIVAESKVKGTVGVVGGLHGDFGALDPNLFEDLTPLATKLKDRGFPAEFMELGKLGTSRQIYIPSGVSVDNMTYTQLTEWCKNIADKSGRKRCGLPAGPKSLLHRLIQGYMYPAYTGGLVTTYKSSDAATMWRDLKALWQYTNPQSLQIDFMQESMLSGEVWVGFDHVARLKDAFAAKPNDFIAAPAPKGPKGLYYMSVLAGLGIPKSS